jgi:hypothetical protein
VKVGDLVRLMGIVLEVHQAMTNKETGGVQIGIKWFEGSGKMDWEPESWLEVVSESR